MPKGGGGGGSIPATLPRRLGIARESRHGARSRSCRRPPPPPIVPSLPPSLTRFPRACLPAQGDETKPAADAGSKDGKKRKPRTPKRDRPKPTKPKEKATAVASGGVKKKVRTPKKKGGGGSRGDAGPSGKKPSSASIAPGGGGGESKWKHGDWACAKCGAHNFRGKDSCFRCKYARANSVKAASAESAMEYLTRRAGGAKDVDSVQHLWLQKNAFNRDVNDATFDLYLAYADGLENKHKLQILKRAKLAAARAARLVEALKDTPEEERKDGEREGGKKRKRNKKKKRDEDKGGEGKKEVPEAEPKAAKKAKAASEERSNEKRQKAEAKAPAKEEETAKAKAKASPAKKEKAAGAKPKPAEEPEPSPARVTRSRAAKAK